jgi:hypothetical protein
MDRIFLKLVTLMWATNMISEVGDLDFGCMIILKCIIEVLLLSPFTSAYTASHQTSVEIQACGFHVSLHYAVISPTLYFLQIGGTLTREISEMNKYLLVHQATDWHSHFVFGRSRVQSSARSLFFWLSFFVDLLSHCSIKLTTVRIAHSKSFVLNIYSHFSI